MKISTTLAIAVIAYTEAATAACIIGSWPFPNKIEQRNWADHACRGNGGMFTGSFAPGQTKRMCPASSMNPNRAKVLYEVQNLNTRQAFDLGNDDCYRRLVSEIDSCVAGGESTVSGWRFKVMTHGC